MRASVRAIASEGDLKRCCNPPQTRSGEPKAYSRNWIPSLGGKYLSLATPFAFLNAVVSDDLKLDSRKKMRIRASLTKD
jgi:hypothetical protein